MRDRILDSGFKIAQPSHAITEQDLLPEGPTLEQRVAELERKLHDLHYQLCIHVTTEG